MFQTKEKDLTTFVLMSSFTDLFRCLALAQILLLLGLFWRNRSELPNTFPMQFFGWCILGYLLADWPPMRQYPNVFLPLLVLPFLAPVAFWLFAKSLFDDHFKWRSTYGWLFASVVGIHYFAFFQTKQALLFLPDGLQILFEWVIQLISLLFIGLGIFEAIQNQAADLVLSRLQFRRFFVQITAGLMVLTVLSEVSLRGAPPPLILDLAQKAFIFGLTLFFALRTLAVKQGFFPVLEKTKPGTSTTSVVDQALLTQLAVWMDEEKYWRTEGLTIRQLSEQMQVKEYRLRQTINQHLGYRNFNDFLNSYRIREACKCLANPEKKELIILEIAYDTGFASLAPFNKAFKEITGMTPTEWRRSKQG